MPEPKDRASKPESANETALVKTASQDPILPEIIEAIKQEGTHVDVNVLLVQIVNKTEDPDEIVANAEKLLVLAQKFEEKRVENFKRMADALIEVKLRDPDEIDKRKNNRIRRYLKGIVGGCSLVGLGGGVLGILLGGNIVAVGVLLTAGCVGLAMSGPLATGESMSSSDVVRIFSAMRAMVPGSSNKGEDDAPNSKDDEGRGRAPRRTPDRKARK